MDRMQDNEEIVESLIKSKILVRDFESLLRILTYREGLLDELLEIVKKFSCKYLCLLDEDEEAMLYEHFDDDICRLMQDACMSYTEANSILSVVEAVLNGVRDKMHNY